MVSETCTTDSDLFTVSCTDVRFDVRLKEGCLLSDGSHPFLRQGFVEAFYISRQGSLDGVSHTDNGPGLDRFADPM